VVGSEEVQHVIAPDGEELDNLSLTTYSTSWRGDLRGMPLSSLRAATADHSRQDTHRRCIAHEERESWRDGLETNYGSSHREEELQRGIRSSLRAKRRTREELEQRWGRWQQRQQRSSAGGATGSSATSVMPAGMRRAKDLHQLYPGGMRLPLFGEDNPSPMWTTLAAAPWVSRHREKTPVPPQEAPWLRDEERAPPQGKARYTLLSARDAPWVREEEPMPPQGRVHYPQGGRGRSKVRDQSDLPAISSARGSRGGEASNPKEPGRSPAQQGVGTEWWAGHQRCA